ncbi:hypothetical protein VSR01_10570 [Actinacidiphila sp. DG2A-62]|uniref:hypothetical protein n=1 Tax=Actinacidiphila sp. DG2A-62 TaxID=3108821 RepID=UPI002DBAB480|nr:hypothetical protein [Actinacidiphila sp. DG2A-62]MEC3993961.1 hypothetical protein [Actinacidiphila sp. DG2A-62]
MKLTLFRRRRIDPAELPPVSEASVPGPMHSGLVADVPAARLTPGPVRAADLPAAAHLAGAEGLATAMADAAATAPLTRPVAKPGPPPVTRSTFRVTFDGRVPDLTAHQITRVELETAVERHVRPYFTGLVEVVIDQQMPFVLLRAGDRTVCRGTFVVLPTGGGLR